MEPCHLQLYLKCFTPRYLAKSDCMKRLLREPQLSERNLLKPCLTCLRHRVCGRHISHRHSTRPPRATRGKLIFSCFCTENRDILHPLLHKRVAPCSVAQSTCAAGTGISPTGNAVRQRQRQQVLGEIILAESHET